MTVSQPHWEHNLLALALPNSASLSAHAHSHRPADNPLLAQAYAYCAALTAYHSRSFYLSSGLMPEGQRLAARALYAFCRISDDIVDNPHGNTLEALERWRGQAFNPFPVAATRLCWPGMMPAAVSTSRIITPINCWMGWRGIWSRGVIRLSVS